MHYIYVIDSNINNQTKKKAKALKQATLQKKMTLENSYKTKIAKIIEYLKYYCSSCKYDYEGDEG